MIKTLGGITVLCSGALLAVGGFLVICPLWFLKDQMIDSGPFQKLSLGCRVKILNTMPAVLVRKDFLTKHGALFLGSD